MEVTRLFNGFLAAALAGFDNIGRSIEAIPGWRRFERFLNEIADGFAFAIAFFWALRWWWLVCGLGIVAAGLQNS